MALKIPTFNRQMMEKIASRSIFSSPLPEWN